MSNGLNEPIQFTRGDSERLTKIELKVHEMSKHIRRIVNFGYVVGVTVMTSAIGVFVKIVFKEQ